MRRRGCRRRDGHVPECTACRPSPGDAARSIAAQMAVAVLDSVVSSWSARRAVWGRTWALRTRRQRLTWAAASVTDRVGSRRGQWRVGRSCCRVGGRTCLASGSRMLPRPSSGECLFPRGSPTSGSPALRGGAVARCRQVGGAPSGADAYSGPAVRARSRITASRTPGRRRWVARSPAGHKWSSSVQTSGPRRPWLPACARWRPRCANRQVTHSVTGGSGSVVPPTRRTGNPAVDGAAVTSDNSASALSIGGANR
jgi:hypothetical protein